MSTVRTFKGVGHLKDAEALPAQHLPEAAPVFFSRPPQPAGVGRTWGTRLWLLSQVALGATALAGAEPGSSARPTAPLGSALPDRFPRIVFAEPEFDFGKIKAGEVVRHEFVFTNAGNGLLELSKVVPGCGCTTITATNQPIPPGQTGVIPIKFNPRGLNGLVSRPITVYANDPMRSNSVLRIRAEVWTPSEGTPAVVVFNHGLESATNDTKVLRVLNHLKSPVEVWIDHWTNRSFEAVLKTVRPGKEFALEITAVPPLGRGTVVQQLKLKTSSKEVPALTVSICANEQSAVVVTPKQLTLPEGPIPAPERRAVMIRNLGPVPLSLSGVELDLPGLEPTVSEIQPGRLFSIVVSFPAGFQAPAGQLGQLRVRTNDPRHPVIGFPLTRAGLPRTAHTQIGATTNSPTFGLLAPPNSPTISTKQPGENIALTK